VDHLIVSLHFHACVFIMVIACLLLYYIPDIPLALPVYLLLFGSTTFLIVSCRSVYALAWFPTLILSVSVWIIYLFTVWLLSIVGIFLTMIVS
jgi:hypothetical protein